VRRLLAPHYDVRAFENGARALEAARAERPDLILTDIMLPELDGIELLRALRGDPATRSVPVILASARAGQGAAIEGLDAGADDYLVKPFTAGELLARVRSHVALGRARTQLAAELATKVEERTAELQQIAAELRRSEQKFQQLTSAINESFWITDLATRATLYISPAYERIWGRSCESLYGRPRSWLDTVHPDDRDRVLKSADRAGVDEAIFDEEYRIVRPDGTVRWIHGRAFPVRDETGAVYRLAGVAEDVTDRKLAEAEGLRLQWQLQQSQKLEALGTLTGGIAHDFNNILAAILGNVELVRQDIPPDHIARDSINEIAAASQRAKELVKRLLSFSRPAEPNRTSFELNTVLQEAVRLMRAALPAGVELNFESIGQLPPIEGDPSSIHQIALNLVTNAWHALKGKPGRIDIQLAACRVDSTLQQKSPELRAGPHVRLSVSDTGSGIEPEVMNRLFEPFFTTKQQGTGLGLAVVHGIVRTHGGAILVDTAVGRGSTFHVYLPAAATAVQERALSPERNVTRGHGETIMFVDDEPVLARLARASLSKLGYLVEAFEKPADALAAFRAHPDSYDLVITDYNMPHMSGVELAKHFVRIQPSVPIALITGFLRQEEIEQAQSSGIREIILKPIGVEELGPVVVRLLAESRAQEPLPVRM
jgi:PAS domain S-box-containing protein